MIYKLIYQCPTHYNCALLGLFVPISYRYVGILSRHETEKLQHWWTIVLLRIGLAITNTMALKIHDNGDENGGGCSIQQHMFGALFHNNSNSDAPDGEGEL